ncbi:MAG: AraC family transcriptional regulator [Pseudomonadota bacterium]
MQQQHSILATLILPVAKALRTHGIDPMQLFEQAGIDAASVINPDRRIAMDNMQALWRLAEEATGDDCLGLEAAEELQPATLQGLGLAILASSTLYDVLSRLVRFAHIYSTGLDLELVNEGEWVDVQFHHAPGLSPSWISQDFSMGIGNVLCRLTLGEYVSPFCIECKRPPPSDPDRYVALMGAPVSFNSAVNRVRYVRSDIVEQLASANPELARVNDEQAETYLASFTSVSTSRAVVARIIERLPDGPPAQKDIAESMHMSNRTLQRKLKDEGTSFIDLLGDARLSLARKYLVQPQRSIVEIAYLLGFSEPSTFSRAFKRWTGQAPAEFRAAALAERADP